MTHKRRNTAIGWSIACLVASATAHAQEFDVSRHTVDGGGGSGAGGGFTLVGTVGQPDAGAMSGGGFEVFGGFWPGAGSGDDCNGRESIASVKCKTKRGAVKKAIVKIKNGTPGQEYTAVLDTGQQITLAAKGTGKATFKFKGGNKPGCGSNAVSITPCDLRRDLDCNCD